jgi:hypothetical protein
MNAQIDFDWIYTTDIGKQMVQAVRSANGIKKFGLLSFFYHLEQFLKDFKSYIYCHKGLLEAPHPPIQLSNRSPLSYKIMVLNF